MLVKLLKYELRSTSRIILYIYAGILAAATLMGILGRFLSGRWETTDGMTIVFGAEDANSIVATLFLALFLIYFFLMAALCVLTIVMIIAFVVIIMNYLADILCQLVDPRARLN